MKPHTQNAEGGPGTRGSGPQQQAESVIDCRVRFQKSPVTFLAVALGGGVLIGIASNKRTFPEPHRKRLSWDWNDSVAVIKSILIGIAITQTKKVLFDPMPHQQPTPGKAQAHPD
jgi:hypothetical protein